MEAASQTTTMQASAVEVAAGARAACYWPQDVLTEILSNLGPLDLCKMACVSQAWKAVCFTPRFWRKLQFTSRAITKDQFMRIISRVADHIQTLEINRNIVSKLEDVFVPMFSNLRSLNELSLEAVGPCALQAMDAIMSNQAVLTRLQKISLTGIRMEFSNTNQVDLVFSQPSLTHLVLRQCYFRRLTLQDLPELRYLDLTASSFMALTMTLPGLQELNISEFGMPPRATLWAITTLTSVTKLVSESAVNMTDEVMAGIGQHLTNLEVLNVSNCKSINLSGLGNLRALRILTACGCDGVKDTDLQGSLQACWSLEEVRLDNCTGLNNVTLTGLQPLRLLSMQSCANLKTVNLRCARLRDLLLGKLTPSMHGSAQLSSVSVYSVSMNKICWSFLPSLEAVQLDCPSLTHLSLTDCDKLRDDTVSSWSSHTTQLPTVPTVPGYEDDWHWQDDGSADKYGSRLGWSAHDNQDDAPPALPLTLSDSSSTGGSSSDSDGLGGMMPRRVRARDPAGQRAPWPMTRSRARVYVGAGFEERDKRRMSVLATAVTATAGAAQPNAAGVAPSAAAGPSSKKAAVAAAPAPQLGRPVASTHTRASSLRTAQREHARERHARSRSPTRIYSVVWTRDPPPVPEPAPAPAPVPAAHAPRGPPLAHFAAVAAADWAAEQARRANAPAAPLAMLEPNPPWLAAAAGGGGAVNRPGSTELGISESSGDDVQLGQVAPVSRRRRQRCRPSPSRGPSRVVSGLHGVREVGGGIWPPEKLEPVTNDGLRFDQQVAAQMRRGTLLLLSNGTRDDGSHGPTGADEGQADPLPIPDPTLPIPSIASSLISTAIPGPSSSAARQPSPALRGAAAGADSGPDQPDVTCHCLPWHRKRVSSRPGSKTPSVENGSRQAKRLARSGVQESDASTPSSTAGPSHALPDTLDVQQTRLVPQGSVNTSASGSIAPQVIPPGLSFTAGAHQDLAQQLSVAAPRPSTIMPSAISVPDDAIMCISEDELVAPISDLFDPPSTVLMNSGDWLPVGPLRPNPTHVPRLPAPTLQPPEVVPPTAAGPSNRPGNALGDDRMMDMDREVPRDWRGRRPAGIRAAAFMRQMVDSAMQNGAAAGSGRPGPAAPMDSRQRRMMMTTELMLRHGRLDRAGVFDPDGPMDHLTAELTDLWGGLASDGSDAARPPERMNRMGLYMLADEYEDAMSMDLMDAMEARYMSEAHAQMRMEACMRQARNAGRPAAGVLAQQPVAPDAAAAPAAAPPAPLVQEQVARAVPSCLPALRELVLDGCDGLRAVRFTHKVLRTLSLARCSDVRGVALNCPALAQLTIKECGALKAVGLDPVQVRQLCLGSTPLLAALHVNSPSLADLDLKGCGSLAHLDLRGCSSLKSLDAQFCNALDGVALAAAVSSMPPLEKLILPVNAKLSEAAITAIQGIRTLTSLDLSYTDVRDVYSLTCQLSGLSRLIMVSCQQLQADSLVQLLEASAYRSSSPQLRVLDCSYCNLGPNHVIKLLRQGHNLESLSLNGVSGVDDSLWHCLHSLAPGSSPAAQLLTNLTSLSLVRCTELKTLCLGLSPDQPLEIWPAKRYNCYDHAATAKASLALTWTQTPHPVLPQLKSLRLGLGQVQVLALSLPNLTSLDISSCTKLRALELRCPALATLEGPVCTSLPRPCLEACLLTLPQLQQLSMRFAAQLQGVTAPAAAPVTYKPSIKEDSEDDAMHA